MKWLGLALVLAVTVGLVLWIGPARLARIVEDRDALHALLDEKGAWAPVVMISLQALQVVLAPIPGHLLGVASGYLFGTWKGTFYTALGVGIGSAIVLVIARWFGRPLLERALSPDALERADRWAARRGPLFFAVIFLVPFVPDDLACVAIGLSGLPLLPMLGVVVLSRLPGHFVSAWVGAHAQQVPAAVWAILGAIAIVVMILAWRYRRTLDAWMLSKIDRPGSTGSSQPRR